MTGISATKRPIVAFVGLPSGGKSTMINSLIGERILQSGTCRTTTELNELSNEIIVDDDGYQFIAMDFAGICDSEENDTKFNEMTYAHITRANIICFVSDVNKAFITTHEVNEYNKIKKIVKDIERETGTIYNIAIVLTKCDFDANHKRTANITKNITKNMNTREIVDSDEETDLCDLIDKIRTKMPNDDIILFNAFGRIAHNQNVSPNLQKIVTKSHIVPTKYNTTFSIKKYVDNTDANQEQSYKNKFEENMKSYLITPNATLDKVTTAFYNMCTNNQHAIFEKYIEGDIGEKQYKFIEKILSKKKELYNKYFRKIESYVYHYNVRCINNYPWNNGIMTTQQIDCHNLISKSFEYIEESKQIDIMDSVIFNGGVFCKNMDRVMFLQNCFTQTGGFEKYDFERKFNKFILLCNPNQFTIMYDCLIEFTQKHAFKLRNSIRVPKIEEEFLHTNTMTTCNTCKKEIYGNYDRCNICGWRDKTTCNIDNSYSSYIKTKGIPYSLRITNEDKIETMMNEFFDDWKTIINDKLYILYNKLQILKKIIPCKLTFGVSHSRGGQNEYGSLGGVDVTICDFYQDYMGTMYMGNIYTIHNGNIVQYSSNNGISATANWNQSILGKRIKSSPGFKKIINEFNDKLLGNSVIGCFDESNMSIMFPSEVLYKITDK